jgi:hypothetical protein
VWVWEFLNQANVDDITQAYPKDGYGRFVSDISTADAQ